jgi:hypothetical protein
LKPEIFGEQPQGIDAAANAGKELLLNNALPAGLGKLGELISGGRAGLATRLSNFPAVREGAVGRMTEQIQNMLRQEPMQAGKFQMLPDYQPLGDVQPISITPGKEFQAASKGKPFQMPTKPIVDASGPVVKGEDKLSQLISGSKIDAEKTLDELTGPNASRYADAMPPETYATVKDLLGTMQGMQKKTTLDRIINYRQGRLVWGAGMGALAALGHPGTALLGEGLREGPVVLNAMLGRIMENPETAKLVTAALQTPASAPQAGLIQKALQVALPRLAQAGADVAATPER